MKEFFKDRRVIAILSSIGTAILAVLGSLIFMKKGKKVSEAEKCLDSTFKNLETDAKNTADIIGGLVDKAEEAEKMVEENSPESRLQTLENEGVIKREKA
jgi:hypothetical protein